MKKLILSLGLLASVTSVANAQATFGIKAGGSLTTITGDGTDDNKSRIGFHGGLLANLPFGDALAIQPEVLYSMKGAEAEIGGETYKASLSYVDIPVMLQYNADGLFFEAGPQLGILMSAKRDEPQINLTTGTITKAEIDAKDEVNTIDFGYAVGLGYKLETGPMIGLRYNGGITKLDKEGDGSSRNSAFQLYVGYMFGGN
jgi:hypothetical protein